MPITLAVNAMGTRFELVLAGDDPHRLRAVGELAMREITECHARFNLFDPGSWLNTINRQAYDAPVVLDDLSFQLLGTCQQVYTDSGGAFDVTIAPLMHAVGLHRSDGPCSEQDIDRARARVGMQHVKLDPANRTIRFMKPGIALDLGAVAKGFAIDLAVEVLREHGVTCALLHGGTSTAAAIGSPPEQDAWQIKIHDPHGSPEPHNTTLALKDEAMSVSAPTGRVIETDDQTIGHVLDPRTGESAMAHMFAAAVGPSACLADAWSTALLVLGQRPDTMPHDMRAVLSEPAAHTSTHPTNNSTKLEGVFT